MSPISMLHTKPPLLLMLSCLGILFLMGCSGARSTPTAPAWASNSGIDQYGEWADLSVGGAVQRMRWIQPGTYLRGSPDDEVNRHEMELQHKVVLTRGFWVADTPCTQELWSAVTGHNPAKHQIDPRHPVEQVSWIDVHGFLMLLSQKHRIPARLPTEAEWEYMARAGSTGAIYAPTLDAIAWHQDNSGGKTQPVGRKEPNAWGIYDTLGLVWEWCYDMRVPYPDSTVIDPIGYMQTPRGNRVRRGSSYRCDPAAMRVAARLSPRGYYRSDHVGFRFVIDAE